jgi:hypothetical protein
MTASTQHNPNPSYSRRRKKSQISSASDYRDSLSREQSTRDVRLRALQAAADLQSALADLERAIGEPPPGAPDAAPGPTKP